MKRVTDLDAAFELVSWVGVDLLKVTGADKWTKEERETVAQDCDNIARRRENHCDLATASDYRHMAKVLRGEE